MDYLPSEILEKIFLDKVIDHRDLAKLQCVCKRFNDISNSNDIWCSKFKHAFPQLFQQIDDNHIVNNVSWKQELKKRLEIVEFVKDNLEMLSHTMINRLKIYHHTYQPGGHNIIHATSLFTQQLTTQNVISDSLVIYIR